MRKMFLLSALCCAMWMNAQITFEGVIDGAFGCGLYLPEQYFNVGKLPIVSGDTLLTLYNEDLSLYKEVKIPSYCGTSKSVPMSSARRAPQGGPSYNLYMVSKNLFTTDGKICFIQHGCGHLRIYNEDAQLVQDLGDLPTAGGVVKVGNSYMLFLIDYVYNYDSATGTYTEYNKTYIYSLPGNGDFDTAIENNPAVPAKQSSNAYKVIENGQVYIVLDGVKYAVTGVEK